MAILGENDVFMVCEDEYAYDGVGLVTWKVIWVIWNVKFFFGQKAIFRFVRWYIWAKNGDFWRKMTFSWIVKVNMHIKG
jgi:hypothetical protein